jgi:SAM-dependent methyltransferase
MRVTDDAPYYRDDLTHVHHTGFGFHAERCAPGVLALLRPVLDSPAPVLELGCGSGLLTRYLVEAGYGVIATDASPAMLNLVRDTAPEVAEVRRLTLPDDPLPEAAAIVSVGHVLNYLPDLEAVHGALVRIAQALRPGGVFALDVCEPGYASWRLGLGDQVRTGEGWVLTTRFSHPSPDRFVREIIVFTREEDGRWRRDDERHDNVLFDASAMADLLAEHGVPTEVSDSFGGEELPGGLKTLVGVKRG